MAPDGYLRGVLADGTRPFRHRARVRALLGLPEDTGVRVDFAPAAPRAGFTYVHHPHGTGEPYPPGEALTTASRRPAHTADGPVDPAEPVTTGAGRPAAGANTLAGRPAAVGGTAQPAEPDRTEQPPASSPAPGPESTVFIPDATVLPDATVAPDATTTLPRTVIPGITAIPGTTAGLEHHTGEAGMHHPAPRRAPESAEQPWPVTGGRPGPGTAPAGEQTPAGTSGWPWQGPAPAAGTGSPPRARPATTAHRDEPAGGAESARRRQPRRSITTGSSPAGPGAGHPPWAPPEAEPVPTAGPPAPADRTGPRAARTTPGWRPSVAPPLSTAMRPAIPSARQPWPEPAPDADRPTGAVTRRPPYRQVPRRAVSGSAPEDPLREVEPPYRPAAPEAPPAQPAEAPAAPSQVVTVREPAVAPAFWERRYLSRLRARILR